MEKISIQGLLFLLTVAGVLGKYIFVQNEGRKTWHEAQEYCTQHYTDLSPLSGPRDEDKLRASAGRTYYWCAWIGLYREPSNVTGWRWSGGGYASYQNFAPQQPTNTYGEYYGCIDRDGWYDISHPYLEHFFCLNLVVVNQLKTWEEALEFCRERHTDLTSLLSDTELLLAHREVREKAKTELVWTGLRYLGDRWLWVNGDPLDYQAWPQGGGHRCPARSLHCGAVGREGPWEAHDCEERLEFICY